MPYLIVAAILIIGAGAFFVMQPAEEMVEETATAEEAARIDVAAEDDEEDNSDDTAGVAETGLAPDTVDGETDAFTSGMAEPTPEPLDTPVTPPASDGASGSFSGEASYSTGRSIHELVVTLTLENDIVVASDIRYDGQGAPTTPMLRSFDSAYEAEVLGKDIDDIQLSRVGGASWTSDAFNEAVDTIQQQAS